MAGAWTDLKMKGITKPAPKDTVVFFDPLQARQGPRLSIRIVFGILPSDTDTDTDTDTLWCS